MKYWRFSFLIFLNIFFLNCSSDDPLGNIALNEMQIGNYSVDIDNAYILNDGIFFFDIILISDGLEFDENNSLTGEGTFIVVKLRSQEEDTLTFGSYKYPSDGTVFSIHQLRAGANIDLDNGEFSQSILGESGKIKYTNSGETVRINIDVQSGNNVSFKAKYSGSLITL